MLVGGPTALEKLWSERASGGAFWGPSHDFLTFCLKNSTHRQSEAQEYPLLKTYPLHFLNKEATFLVSLARVQSPSGNSLLKGQETGSGPNTSFGVFRGPVPLKLPQKMSKRDPFSGIQAQLGGGQASTYRRRFFHRDRGISRRCPGRWRSPRRT